MFMVWWRDLSATLRVLRGPRRAVTSSACRSAPSAWKSWRLCA